MKKAYLAVAAAFSAALNMPLAKTNGQRGASSGKSSNKPHQGKKEMARRRRQLAKGQLVSWQPFVFEPTTPVEETL